MPWVLDGNNLAGGADRERVRRAALFLSHREKVQLLVFFDGAPPDGVPEHERLGAVEIRYVSNADRAILAFLAQRKTGVKLVTADRALASKAKALGAEVVAPGVFWQKVARAWTAMRWPSSLKRKGPPISGRVSSLSQKSPRALCGSAAFGLSA